MHAVPCMAATGQDSKLRVTDHRTSMAFKYRAGVVTYRRCVGLALYCICMHGVCDAGSDVPHKEPNEQGANRSRH
jgi:hypothetical protein